MVGRDGRGISLRINLNPLAMIIPDPNPVLGATIHTFGGVSASTCYVPFEKVKQWTWESYWLVFSVFAWLITPLIVGFLTVPELLAVISESPAHVKWKAFLLGAVYGFGGMSFGFAIKHIGYSLTYTIAIGISAVLGTIVPLMLNGTLIAQFEKPGGMILLAGMGVALLGVAGCGWAGFRKENDLNKLSGAKVKGAFNMSRGLSLAVFAGILSAVFGISLAIGQPIADIAASHGAGHYEGNSKIILSTTGCLLTNVIWFVILGIRRGTLHELKFKNGLPPGITLKNYLLAILSGVLWYMQFFFYGLATVRMGMFDWSSWVIHMSMLIFFSFFVGVIFREWRKVTKMTYAILIIALVVLLFSFVIMTWGSVRAERSVFL
jgi:L-rhamnose-H+ transport protein